MVIEIFMISWNIANMMFLCAHCLNDDWQWRNDLETDKAKIKLGLNATFWNLLCLICVFVLHILPENIDRSIVTYISVDEDNHIQYYLPCNLYFTFHQSKKVG